VAGAITLAGIIPSFNDSNSFDSNWEVVRSMTLNKADFDGNCIINMSDFADCGGQVLGYSQSSEALVF